MPVFFFMTGANRYRCEAKSKEEVLQIVAHTLRPSDDVMALIRATLYQEEEARLFVDPGASPHDIGDDRA
jgi:hypothetical protein